MAIGLVGYGVIVSLVVGEVVSGVSHMSPVVGLMVGVMVALRFLKNAFGGNEVQSKAQSLKHAISDRRKSSKYAREHNAHQVGRRSSWDF